MTKERNALTERLAQMLLDASEFPIESFENMARKMIERGAAIGFRPDEIELYAAASFAFLGLVQTSDIPEDQRVALEDAFAKFSSALLANMCVRSGLDVVPIMAKAQESLPAYALRAESASFTQH